MIRTQDIHVAICDSCGTEVYKHHWTSKDRAMMGVVHALNWKIHEKQLLCPGCYETQKEQSTQRK